MDPSKIQQTIQLWQAEPGKAQARPTVKAWSDGSQAVIEAGPFSWRADLPPSLGGKNEAPSPVALLLGALAGCAVALLRDTLAPQLGVQVDEVHAVVGHQHEQQTEDQWFSKCGLGALVRVWWVGTSLALVVRR